MSFSAAALEEMSLLEIFQSVRDLASVFELPLPTMFKKSLTYYFIDQKKLKFKKNLYCQEVPACLEGAVTPGYMNLLRMNDLDNWDWTIPTPLPADLFHYLFSQDLSYNSFFIESPTHFMTVRFTKYKRDTVPYDMCEPCLNRDLDYWHCHYTRKREHVVYSSNTAMMYILESKNWCSNCVTTPLFRLYDERTCSNNTGLHQRLRRKRFRGGMFWGSHVESDDDSDDDSFISEPWIHPRLVR